MHQTLSGRQPTSSAAVDVAHSDIGGDASEHLGVSTVCYSGWLNCVRTCKVTRRHTQSTPTVLNADTSLLDSAQCGSVPDSRRAECSTLTVRCTAGGTHAGMAAAATPPPRTPSGRWRSSRPPTLQGPRQTPQARQRQQPQPRPRQLKPPPCERRHGGQLHLRNSGRAAERRAACAAACGGARSGSGSAAALRGLAPPPPPLPGGCCWFGRGSLGVEGCLSLGRRSVGARGCTPASGAS